MSRGPQDEARQSRGVRCKLTGGDRNGRVDADVPTISEFFGIVIRMYYEDHQPPHFHAYYNYEATIAIETLELLEGSLPRRVKALVIEWAVEHRQALMEDWQLAQQHQPLRKIEPLE